MRTNTLRRRLETLERQAPGNSRDSERARMREMLDRLTREETKFLLVLLEREKAEGLDDLASASLESGDRAEWERLHKIMVDLPHHLADSAGSDSSLAAGSNRSTAPRSNRTFGQWPLSSSAEQKPL
jgi:hypothetical protein